MKLYLGIMAYHSSHEYRNNFSYVAMLRVLAFSVVGHILLYLNEIYIISKMLNNNNSLTA